MTKNIPKKCANCSTSSTPTWRKNPCDPNSLLCNACGIRFRRTYNEEKKSDTEDKPQPQPVEKPEPSSVISKDTELAISKTIAKPKGRRTKHYNLLETYVPVYTEEEYLYWKNIVQISKRNNENFQKAMKPINPWYRKPIC